MLATIVFVTKAPRLSSMSLSSERVDDAHVGDRIEDGEVGCAGMFRLWRRRWKAALDFGERGGGRQITSVPKTRMIDAYDR